MTASMPADISALDGVMTADRPPMIFIGTAARMRRGVDHVWQYELVAVGSSRMYVCRQPSETTFRGDLMFIVPEQSGDDIWFVAYEGREVDGQLEQRQPVFRTRSNFWEVGDHEWEVNEATHRGSYAMDWVEPQWRSSGWNVCTRHSMAA